MPDDLALPALNGGTIDPQGRPALVVNTASLCGFTPQYAGLQKLHEEWAARGLMVVAVPSNQFGRQEPGDASTIGATCERLHVTFPVAAKAEVTGPGALPLFQRLATAAGPLGKPRWNFYKYVIGRDGQLVAWFSSMTNPSSGRLRAALARAVA